jgi:hypothetical protein
MAYMYAWIRNTFNLQFFCAAPFSNLVKDESAHKRREDLKVGKPWALFWKPIFVLHLLGGMI